MWNAIDFWYVYFNGWTSSKDCFIYFNTLWLRAVKNDYSYFLVPIFRSQISFSFLLLCEISKITCFTKMPEKSFHKWWCFFYFHNMLSGPYWLPTVSPLRLDLRVHVSSALKRTMCGFKNSFPLNCVFIHVEKYFSSMISFWHRYWFRQWWSAL